MPKYDFICPEGHTKEVTCKVSEYDPEQRCDEPAEDTDFMYGHPIYRCDQLMERVYTTFGIVIR